MIPLAVVFALVFVVGAGYLGYRSAQPSPAAAVQTPPTIAVDHGDVVQSITAPGQLVGTREQMLSLNVGGRVSVINVRAGDKVKAGDALAQLDETNLQYALQTAQATLA